MTGVADLRAWNGLLEYAGYRSGFTRPSASEGKGLNWRHVGLVVVVGVPVEVMMTMIFWPSDYGDVLDGDGRDHPADVEE